MRILILLLLSCLYASGANLVHNSSFEIGTSGWFVWGNTNKNDVYGNEAAIGSLVVSTNGSATHGSHSVVFQTRLIARPFLMPAGPCALTFDARGYNAGILSAGVQQTYKARVGAELIPTNNFSLTTSWQRFTNVFIAPTSGWYMVKFVAGRTWIDRVQVETGAVATAYAPMPLEVGMDTADPENVLFQSDARVLRFNFWNAMAAATNVSVYYQLLSSIWNTNIASGIISTNALATNVNVTINLAMPIINGSIRALCYITNVNNTMDETSVAVFPFEAQSGRNTNGLLGLDTHSNPYHLISIRRIGFSWIRVFSLTKYTRWMQQFPTLTTTNIYNNKWISDYVLETIATNDLVPLLVLTGEDNQWYPETNASLSVMIGNFTNYVVAMVDRYSQAPFNIKHWEIFNEPHQTGRTNPNVSDATIYANIYTNSARAVKLVDPTATVIGFGGYSQGSLGDAAWAEFTPQGKADADGLSFHLYPQMNGDTDPNAPDDYRAFSTANLDPIIQSFKTVRPLLMTEAFIADAGGYHGPNQTFEYPFFWGASPNWLTEAEFNTHDNMAMPAMDRITYSFVRTIGWGFKQYTFQSGRMTDDTVFQSAHPTIYEINNTFKPWAVALAIANYFIQTPGLGRITNAASPNYVEAYLHTNTLGVVVSIFCPDRTNRTLSFSSSPGAFFDTMGNLISFNATSLQLTRSVRYIRSATLTASQMTNLIMTAGVTITQDVIAPGVTVDLSPTGETIAWGVTGTNAFKATALDDTVVQYGGHVGQPAPVIPSNQTNVQYRWSINAGATWTPWNPTNHFYHSFAGPGMYNISWQAKDLANNISPMVTGPTFGDLTPGATNSLNVSGTANIGTITVTGP